MFSSFVLMWALIVANANSAAPLAQPDSQTNTQEFEGVIGLADQNAP